MGVEDMEMLVLLKELLQGPAMISSIILMLYMLWVFTHVITPEDESVLGPEPTLPTGTRIVVIGVGAISFIVFVSYNFLENYLEAVKPVM